MSLVPNLFIPGAAKSATTYLYSCLGKNSNIFVPEVKEMHYMASDCMGLPLKAGDPFKSYEEHIIADYNRYLEYYTGGENFRYRLDCSPTYMFYRETAEKIKSLSPDAKIIISLRNPVDRAFSLYKMNVRTNREELAFEEALDAEKERAARGDFPAGCYGSTGLYSENTASYIEAFGRENVFILLFEEINENPKAVFSKICSFLGVTFEENMVHHEKEHYTGFPKYSLINRLVYAPALRKTAKKLIAGKKLRKTLNNFYVKLNDKNVEMDHETRIKLVDFYREDIDKLEDVTGLDLTGWK